MNGVWPIRSTGHTRHAGASPLFSALATLAAVMMLARPAAAENFYFRDFSGGGFHGHTFKIIGAPQRLHPGKEGLRITIAGSNPKAANAGIAYPLKLFGDCELQAAVEFIDVPAPSGGYGTGVALLLEDGVEKGASLQLIRTGAGDLQYVAHHFVIDEAGEYHHKAKAFPTKATRVILRMNRVKDSLLYYVSEDGGKSFRQLDKVPFTDRPLSTVQVYAQTGGEPNDLDLRLLNFRVAADHIQQPAQTPPAERNRVSWWWVAGVCVGLPVGIIGVWWIAKRRSKPE